MKGKQITASPATSGLLLAIHYIQRAEDAYYSALESIGGEDMAEQGLEEYDALSSPLRAYVEAEILDNIRDWAACPEMPAEV